MTRFVATWSEEDKTTPLAQLVTSANHAGGRPAFRRARAYEGRFVLKQWDPNAGLTQPQLPPATPGKRCPCDFQPPEAPLVELVDATSIVKRHGDVGDEEMAALLWDLIRDTGPQAPDQPAYSTF